MEHSVDIHWASGDASKRRSTDSSDCRRARASDLSIICTTKHRKEIGQAVMVVRYTITYSITNSVAGRVDNWIRAGTEESRWVNEQVVQLGSGSDRGRSDDLDARIRVSDAIGTGVSQRSGIHHRVVAADRRRVGCGLSAEGRSCREDGSSSPHVDRGSCVVDDRIDPWRNLVTDVHHQRRASSRVGRCMPKGCQSEYEKQQIESSHYLINQAVPNHCARRGVPTVTVGSVPEMFPPVAKVQMDPAAGRM